MISHISQFLSALSLEVVVPDASVGELSQQVSSWHLGVRIANGMMNVPWSKKHGINSFWSCYIINIYIYMYSILYIYMYSILYIYICIPYYIYTYVFHIIPSSMRRRFWSANQNLHHRHIRIPTFALTSFLVWRTEGLAYKHMVYNMHIVQYNTSWPIPPPTMPLHPRFSKGPKLNAVSFQKPSQTCLFPTCQVSEDLSILTFLPRRMQWSVPGPTPNRHIAFSGGS